METIEDRVFGPDETVLLDGHRFVRCVFNRCGIAFGGAADFALDRTCKWIVPLKECILSAQVFRALDGMRILHAMGHWRVEGFTDADWNSALVSDLRGPGGPAS